MEDKKTIDQIIIDSLYLDIERVLPPPLITIQGKVILTDSNYLTISGLPKSRKTSFMQFFIASALNNNSFFGIKTELKKGEKIVLIDTEQSIFDFQKQNFFLKKLVKKNKLPNNFSAYLFREYEPDVILEAIEKICITDKPKIIFLDNLTELVINPNDLIEAKKVTQFLKKISAKYNCGIVCLLHLNKTNGFTLGNLGSYADRGAQSVLKVSIDKETNISTLECTMLRSDSHFEPISIEYNNENNCYNEVQNINTDTEKRKKFSMANYTKKDIENRLNIIFEISDNYTYSPLCEELKKIFGVGNNSIKQIVIPYLIGNKFLYSKNSNYTLTKN